MRFIQLICMCAVSTAVLAACVLPGSAIGDVAVKGRLLTEDGQPLADTRMDLVLPAEYGLDYREVGHPELFGTSDTVVSVTTDRNGEFTHEIGWRVYHVNTWVLPPLGGYPDRPPAPFFLAQVPSFPNEYYVISSADGDVIVFDDDGSRMSLPDASLVSLTAHHEGYKSEDGNDSTVAVIELVYPAQ